MDLNGHNEGMESHEVYFYALEAVDEMRIFCDNICVSKQ